jgi:hypothetical protein
MMPLKRPCGYSYHAPWQLCNVPEPIFFLRTLIVYCCYVVHVFAGVSVRCAWIIQCDRPIDMKHTIITNTKI